jgi:hypothetical protein
MADSDLQRASPFRDTVSQRGVLSSGSFCGGSLNYASSVQEADYCDGCGKMTVTVHGRCPNCWHEKRLDRVPRRESRQKSVAELFGDGLGELAWFLPGVALIVLAIVVFGDDILLAIGLLVLLSGGALKFGDFFP